MRDRSAPSAFNRTNTIQCFDVWTRRTAQLCLPSLCNFHPAGHSIKHGQFRLLDSGNCVVDREPGFPLEVIGVLFCIPYVEVMLLLSNAFLLSTAGRWKFLSETRSISSRQRLLPISRCRPQT